MRAKKINITIAELKKTINDEIDHLWNRLFDIFNLTGINGHDLKNSDHIHIIFDSAGVYYRNQKQYSKSLDLFIDFNKILKQPPSLSDPYLWISPEDLTKELSKMIDENWGTKSQLAETCTNSEDFTKLLNQAAEFIKPVEKLYHAQYKRMLEPNLKLKEENLKLKEANLRLGAANKEIRTSAEKITNLEKFINSLQSPEFIRAIPQREKEIYDNYQTHLKNERENSNYKIDPF